MTAFERGSRRKAAIRMVYGKTRFYRTCCRGHLIRRRTQDLHIAEPYKEDSTFYSTDEANQIDILLVLLKTRILSADKPNCV